MKNLTKVGFSSILGLGVLLTYGCGKDNNSSNTPPSEPTGPIEPAIELSYIDPRNSSSQVFTSGMIFPDAIDYNPNPNFFTIFGAECPGTATIDYVFTIKNTGTASLTASTTPAVSVSKTTQYWYVGEEHLHNFSITQDPVFPLGPGESTTFTMTYSLPVDCRMTSSQGNTETAQLSINTNDPDDSNFLIDLNVFGNS